MSLSAAEAEKRKLPGRFYGKVSVADGEGDWAIVLDGRTVTTPGKRELRVPNENLARAVAAEWEAQKDVVNPFTMPITRILHVALDHMADMRTEAAEEISRYGRTDLLSHRSDDASLATRQAQLWDPYLDWADTILNAPLKSAVTPLALEQPETSIAALKARALAQDNLSLTALVSAVPILGSAILAFALLEAEADGEAVWTASRVDENHQIERWGKDMKAAEAESAKKHDLLACERVMRMCDKVRVRLGR